MMTRYPLHCDHCGSPLPAHEMAALLLVEQEGAQLVTKTMYYKPCRVCVGPGKKRVIWRTRHTRTRVLVH